MALMSHWLVCCYICVGAALPDICLSVCHQPARGCDPVGGETEAPGSQPAGAAGEHPHEGPLPVHRRGGLLPAQGACRHTQLLSTTRGWLTPATTEAHNRLSWEKPPFSHCNSIQRLTLNVFYTYYRSGEINRAFFVFILMIVSSYFTSYNFSELE